MSLSKVDLHGFASNATVLLRLNAGLQSPSGDNPIPGCHFALLCSFKWLIRERLGVIGWNLAN
ncbi:hypothetical protein SynROS8604_01919 [Synechococcus sp. ROS8604]|nr:hypothetical protein SynROS8604_01919 [Synechococcus sp. ROS8604]